MPSFHSLVEDKYDPNENYNQKIAIIFAKLPGYDINKTPSSCDELNEEGVFDFSIFAVRLSKKDDILNYLIPGREAKFSKSTLYRENLQEVYDTMGDSNYPFILVFSQHGSGLNDYVLTNVASVAINCPSYLAMESKGLFVVSLKDFLYSISEKT